MVENHDSSHRDHTEAIDAARIGSNISPNIDQPENIEHFLGQMPNRPGNGKSGDRQGDVKQVPPKKIIRLETGETERVPKRQKGKNDIGH